MADTIQIGTFDNGGRFTLLLDLNDGVNFSILRDTLNIQPLQGEQAIMAKSGRRYGGAKPVGAMHDNGVFEGEWYLNSPSHTDDATWANFDKLVAILQDANGGPYFIKFQTQGSSHPAYHELKLPVPYDPMYRWIEFQGSKTLHIKVSLAIAPLAMGDPLDVLDGFATDTTGDYTALAGAGTIAWSSTGVVSPTSTVQKLYQHTARGYLNSDTQNTFKFRTGASAAGTGRAIGTLLDANNYLFAELSGGQLNLKKRDSSTESTLVAGTAFALSANTTYYLRFRKEGNNVFAEVFTAAPTPMGAPGASLAATLAGATATKFGAGVKGGDAWLLTPAATDWQINAFNVEPYTYRNQTLPNTLALQGIPGTAPARVDASITPSGGTNPPLWAMLGWWKTPSTGASPAPLGIIEAETRMVTGLNDMAVIADATARGGNMVSYSGTTNTTGNAAFLVDPSLLVPDDFVGDEVSIEVWVRQSIDSTVPSPVLVLSARPESISSSIALRYSHEYGSAGKTLVTSTAANTWRLVRAGTLSLPVIRSMTPQRWVITLTYSNAPGGSGNVKADYLVLVPATSRALGPTGKANDGSTYPKFTRVTTETIRTIRWDLAGFTSIPSLAAGFARDVGLGGQLIEFPTGNVTVAAKLSSLVPDDPTVDATVEQLSHSATLHFAVWPRYHLSRSS